jgi:hypothetical protein
MNKRNVIIVSLFACLLAGAGAALAGKWSGASRPQTQPQRADVTVGGTLSGVMSGTIFIGGQAVDITKNTRIYQIGAGAVDEGTVVNSSFVQASGYRRGDTIVATLVVVSRPNSGRDFSQETVPNSTLAAGAAR